MHAPASWSAAVIARRDAVASSGLRVWLVLLAVLLIVFGALQAGRRVDTTWLGATVTLPIVLACAFAFALGAAVPGAVPRAWERGGRVGGAALVIASVCVALLDAGSTNDARHLLLAIFGVGFAMLVPTGGRAGLSWLIAAAATWPATILLTNPVAITSVSFAQRFVDVVAGTCIAAVALMTHRWVFGGRTRALAQLARLAEHDGLTGALNRRTLIQRLTAEAHRVERHGGAMGVLLLDIDRFKRFNTELGYAAGDQMLIEVAGALEALATSTAWARFAPSIGRYGGEEFVIVLPDADEHALGAFAEACRGAIASLRVEWDGATVQVTSSIGAFLLACDGGARSGGALAAADAAMYRAKRAGGDRVEIAGPDDVPAAQTEPAALAPHAHRATDVDVDPRYETEPRRLHALILRALLIMGGAWTVLFGLLDIALERATPDAIALGPLLVLRAIVGVLGIVIAWMTAPLDRGRRRVAAMHVFVALSVSFGIIALMGTTGGLTSPYFAAVVWLALAWTIAFTAPPLPAMLSVAATAIALTALVPWTPDTEGVTYALLHRVAVLVAAGFVAVGAERRFTRLRHEEARARALLDQMAHVDPLTGLPNRIAVMDRGERLARRGPQLAPLSLVLFDLDHFKRLNDTLGHLAGDEALSAVAASVTSTVRGGDVPGRLGGEEFVVIAPQTDAAGATLLAERLRARIAELVLSDGTTRVTASFGVTVLDPGETVASALGRADTALRTAKDDGRNRVALDARSRERSR